MENVIVNADDFGLKHSINKAIIELFEKALINSTTLMANMPGFGEAIELSHKHKISNKIGAHLVLTSGNPLTESIKLLPYLFDKDAYPRELLVKKLFVLNKTQKSLIFKEYSKQIERIKENGIQITHLDTHQHMHDMWGIIQILVELLKVYKIPSMRIVNNLETRGFYKNTYRDFINMYLKLKKVNRTDYFGSRVDYLLTLEKHSNFVKSKTVEIMVHPDYNIKGELVDKFQKTEYDFDYLNNDFKIFGIKKQV